MSTPNKSETENDLTVSLSTLFESSISRRWFQLSTLCDQYIHHNDKNGTINNKNNNSIDNPLIPAILHTAIIMASKHKSTSIFSDVAPKEMVSTSTNVMNLNTSDFCPYLHFEESIDEARCRRMVIAKLCKLNPAWISAPLVGTVPKDDDFDNPTNNGTTALHLAVRMRNPSLIRLLLKYCPEAAKVQDDLGYLPLHYAVCPIDSLAVYNKAIMMHNSRTNINNNSLIGPMDIENAPNLDAGGGTAGGVSYGMRMVNRAKHAMGSMNEMAFMSRYRVRTQMSRKKRSIATKRKLNSLKMDASSTVADNNVEMKSDHTSITANNTNNHIPARRSSRIKKNDEYQQAKATQYLLFSNLYTSPSSLVRAMIFLGCVDEDSFEFIEAESQASPSDFPLGGMYRGCMRPFRPWKLESHRVDVIRMLVDVYPEGLGVQCNHDDDEDDEESSKFLVVGGGDTPLIMAVRTLKGGLPGEDEEDADFNMDIMNLEGGDAAMAGGVNGEEGNVNNAGVGDNVPSDNGPEEAGPAVIDEEEADYEADFPTCGEDIQSADTNLVEIAAPAAETNIDNNPPELPGQPEQEQPNHDLEAIRIMIQASRQHTLEDNDPLLISNDDEDTPLHMATRIGANHRLVRLLINAQPKSAFIPACDGNTALHLLLRRCSHLAPEGPGGLATYDSQMVAFMVEAMHEPEVMSFLNDECRTPLHEAAYYGASPEVLDVLANAPGGRESLLLRDSEGHTPLGAYCRHAADFYGVRILVNHCPQAAAALADGERLAIHRVLASFNLAVNVDVLNLLGTAYPRGINLKDSHGMTPLALLCQSYKGPMNVDLPKLEANRTTLGRCLSNKVMLMARYLIFAGKANRDWNILYQTKQSELGIDTEQIVKPKERLLHAALRDTATSEEVVHLAVIIDPNQLQEGDEEGNTPLHLACFRESGCTEYTIYPEVLDQWASDDDTVYKTVNVNTNIDKSPIPIETSEDSGKRVLLDHGYDPSASFLPILHTILKKNKAAAQVRNNEGQYPFTVLVDRGASWIGGGIDQVFKAYPAAIFSFNLSNNIVCHAMGRVSRVSETRLGEMKEEEAACLGSMFELLRGKPTVLEGANAELLERPRTKRRPKRIRTK